MFSCCEVTMESKVCTTCKQEKSVSEFYKDKHNKTGIKSNCKTCCAQVSKNSKKYYPVSVTYKLCKKCDSQKHFKEFSRNSSSYDGLKSHCKSCCAETKRRYYQNNKQKCLAYHQTYRQNNLLWYRQYSIEYHKWRRNNDEIFKLREWLKSSVYRALKGEFKEKSTLKYFTYTVSELKENLEKQFVEGMTWENHGIDWEIDHIKPVSVYIEEGETRPEVINALENLQPLWAEENRKKSNKYDELN